MKRTLVLLLILAVAAAAFAGGQGETGGSGQVAMTTGPLEPYDPPLTVTTWRRGDNRPFAEGESVEDNIWTRAIEDELGIIFDYVWISPSGEMDAKINTSIAAGDLPDVMNKLNLEQYYNLARVGRLAPQGDIIATYDVGEVAKYLDYGPGISRDMLTVNGEIYGWGIGPQLGNVNVFAARGDWLAAVGRSEIPSEIDDIIDMLYEFSEEDPDGNGLDDTYGLAVSSNFFGAAAPLLPFFAAYDSYPEIWVQSGSELAYGSVLPETKEVLEVLAQLHADGVLSPEWPVLNPWSQLPDELAQDKVGAMFGQQWVHNYGGIMSTITANPDMQWDHTFVNHANGDPIKIPVSAQVREINVVNSDFSSPEVLVKLYNLHYQKTKNPETADGDFHTIRTAEGAITTFFYWNDFFASHAIDTNPLLALDVARAVDARDPSGLNPEARGYYDASLSYLNTRGTPDVDAAGYGSYRTFGPGGTNAVESWIMIDGENYQIDAYQGLPTRAQATYAGDLRSTRTELFIQMVVGELDIDQGWNQWLAYWEANGGAEWTAEVNEWYQDR